MGLMRRLFRVRPRDASAIEIELREEIEAHVALAAEHLVRRGASPEEAERLARARFGSFDDSMRDLYRSARYREGKVQRREWFDVIGQNLRLSFRRLKSSPASSATITAVLALGFGANLVMFDVVDRLVLSPPPALTHAESIRRVFVPEFDYFTRGTNVQSVTNYPTYNDLRPVGGFTALAAYGFPAARSLGRGRDASQVMVAGASASFFDVAGVKPYVGRFYTSQEDAPPRGSPVAVVSYGFWRRVLGGSSSAIGRTLAIDAMRLTVVGVAPPGFNGVDLRTVDVWIPMTAESYASNADYLSDRGSLWLMIAGRLAPGIDERRIVAEASAVVLHNDARVAKANSRAQVELAPVIAARGPGNHPEVRVAMWLLGVAGIVLIIACANTTTLLLTRAVQRRQEIAVRVALGVSRWRLLEQLLMEGIVLAILGALVAAVAAVGARGIVHHLLMPDTAMEGPPSTRVIAVMLGAIVLVTLVATVAPAAHALRLDVSSTLKAAGRNVAGARSRLRDTLLVLQVALSVTLLIGAGLFVLSWRAAAGTRIGLDPDRVLLAEVNLSRAGMDTARTEQYWQTAMEALARVRHVTSASLSIATPMRFSIGGRFRIPGRDSLPKLKSGGPYRNGVDERFFSTIGAHILRGRGFTAADTRTSPRVVVINEAMAARLWPGANPIGRCVRIYADTIPCATIVGVVEDVHRNQLREDPTFQYYMPYAQWLGGHSTAMLVRLDRSAATADLVAVRQALQGASPDVPFPRVRSYEDIIDPELRSWKLGASMFTTFGALAFIVAVVGLYGLLSHAVAQRRYEFGIRTALGAETGHIVRLVFRHGLGLVVVGVGIGTVLARYLGNRIAPLLLDVSPEDVRVYGGTAVLVVAVALAAAVIPARRAARVDPMEALRAE